MDHSDPATDKTDDHATLDEMIQEVQARIRILERSLPRQIDPIAISRTKLPFKILHLTNFSCQRHHYRGATIWRITELARASFQSFEGEQLAAAIVLARAAVETGAALWYLDEKVRTVLKDGKLRDLDNYVMRLLAGNYSWDNFPDPIRVGKFIDCVERDAPGFKAEYGRLSEFAHPNSTGTTQLYSTIDHKNILVDFGPDSYRLKSANRICMASLSGVLMLFEHIYNHLGNAMPDL